MEANLLAAERTPLLADADRAQDHARSSADQSAETPVFYSPRGVRRRVARAAARALALIASLWLIAIVISALGVRPLGELGLPFGLGGGSRAHSDRASHRVSDPGRLGLPSALGVESLLGDARSRTSVGAAGSAAAGFNTSSGPGGQAGAHASAGRSHNHAGGVRRQGSRGGGNSSGTNGSTPSGNGGQQVAPQTASGPPATGRGSSNGAGSSNAGAGSSQPAYGQSHPAHPAHPAHPVTAHSSTADSTATGSRGHGGSSP